MDKALKISNDQYRQWIAELSKRYQRSQIKAATSVNSEMLAFYWSLGRDIVTMNSGSKYGSSFFDKLSSDLKAIIPTAKCFSPTNLRYMKRFYELVFEISEMLPQDGAESGLSSESIPALISSEKLPQVGAELLSIPWGHIKLLIDKCKSEPQKVLFYSRKTIENNWSRAVLQNWLDTDLYERQGKAITNFALTLPSPQSDLAQEMTRDPYNFDFLTIRAQYDEKELKEALMNNVQRLLMELGTGFAFVGREYRLVIGQTEQILDLLFYNYLLHCFVVVEVKVSDFDPRDMGQLGTYVAAVDGMMRKESDNPTIGLLICKTKDNVLAQYAANVMNAPIGISEYQLNNLLKDEFKGKLPTIEEIERELRD